MMLKGGANSQSLQVCDLPGSRAVNKKSIFPFCWYKNLKLETQILQVMKSVHIDTLPPLSYCPFA
jgi:hypothetical protein